MQVACLRCLPARKPLRRFSTLRRFPPFLPCRTPVRSISDTHPVDIGHRSGPNRTPFRSHRKTVRHQSGRLSDFNRNTVRFESERCPTSNRIGVRFASEYACTQWPIKSRVFAPIFADLTCSYKNECSIPFTRSNNFLSIFSVFPGHCLTSVLRHRPVRLLFLGCLSGESNPGIRSG